MAIWGIIIYLLFFFTFAHLFAKQEGYYSTVTVFGISAFIYYLSIPLEVVLSNQPYMEVGKHGVAFFTPERLNLVVLMAVLALIGFTSGYYCSFFRPFDARDSGVAHRESLHVRLSLPFSPIVISLSSIILILIIFSDKLLNVSTYSGNYATTFQFPLFAYLCKIAINCIVICIAFDFCATRATKLRSYIFATMLIYWGFYTSNKDPILLAILAVNAYFCPPRNKKLWVFAGLILGVIIAFLGLPLFSSYRAGFRGLELFSNYHFSPSKTDPGGAFVSLLHNISNESNRTFGTTYFRDLLLLIPKKLWAGRPLDTANLFAQHVLPNWQPGQGLGFSLMAEGYMNFGLFGSFFPYLLIGFFWGWAWKKIKHYFTMINDTYFHAIYLSIGYYLLILMHRGAFIGTIKTMVHIFLILVPFSFLFDRFFHYNGRILFKKHFL